MEGTLTRWRNLLSPYLLGPLQSPPSFNTKAQLVHLDIEGMKREALVLKSKSRVNTKKRKKATHKSS